MKLKMAAENQKEPQYKFATEIMNSTNQEAVFQKVLDQPITLSLGELLGTLYDLGKRVQMAMKSQHFPIQKAVAAHVKALKEVNSEEMDDSDVDDVEEMEDLVEPSKTIEFKVNSGVASSS